MSNINILGDLKKTFTKDKIRFEIYENNRQMYSEIGFAIQVNGGLTITPSGSWYKSIDEAITACNKIKFTGE